MWVPAAASATAPAGWHSDSASKWCQGHLKIWGSLFGAQILSAFLCETKPYQNYPDGMDFNCRMLWLGILKAYVVSVFSNGFNGSTLQLFRVFGQVRGPCRRGPYPIEAAPVLVGHRSEFMAIPEKRFGMIS